MIEKVKKIRLPLWLKVVLAILAGGVYVWYCIRVFSVSEIDSDYANLVLEASDILKGNIFMVNVFVYDFFGVTISSRGERPKA